jgi:uroporphyrinogen-III decarboxylase
MDEFAEINRRVYRALARQPVNFIWSHDDIMNNRGPICSPAWMHKYCFPRYEEFWGIVNASGKRVLFVADGRMDRYADDVLACGAAGIVSEPVTDWKTIASHHPTAVLGGEGDNRILSRNDPAEIEAMVRSMVETAQTCAGYLMCVGNHIPWDVPPEAIKRYLDLSRELAVR